MALGLKQTPCRAQQGVPEIAVVIGPGISGFSLHMCSVNFFLTYAQERGYGYVHCKYAAHT